MRLRDAAKLLVVLWSKCFPVGEIRRVTVDLGGQRVELTNGKLGFNTLCGLAGVDLNAATERWTASKASKWTGEDVCGGWP